MTWFSDATETDDDHQRQGSKAWHRWRTKHIGASEVSAVLGESDFTTPYELFLLKTGQREPVASNWAMRRGTEAEPEIRRLYQQRYDIELTAPVMEYKHWPVLSASLDGYNEEKSLIVEIKYPSKEKHAMALRDEVPPTYRAQLQAQLLVADCTWAHYVSYDGTDIAVVKVEADLNEQRRILDACRDFWACVLTNTPPKGAPVILESETLSVLAENYKRLTKIAEHTEGELKLIRQKLDELVEEDKAEFHGLVLSRTERVGSVQYDKIPELQGVDLNQYRKRPSKVLTIKEKK
jgi:putative phage-type endonuclease